jgi:hypothetical protein
MHGVGKAVGTKENLLINFTENGTGTVELANNRQELMGKQLICWRTNGLPLHSCASCDS